MPPPSYSLRVLVMCRRGGTSITQLSTFQHLLHLLSNWDSVKYFLWIKKIVSVDMTMAKNVETDVDHPAYGILSQSLGGRTQHTYGSK